MIKRAERKWLWAFSLVVMLLTTLPYLVGYSRQDKDWRYTGMLFGVEDGNTYIAKMLRGANSDWLFRTPYSPYPQSGALVYLPFILLGKLTAPPGQHEQLVAVFHLFRLAGVVAYTWSTYDFMAVFIRETRWRRLGTALVSLGGGLGWLTFLGLGGLWARGMPLEFYSPETFGFLIIYGLPHLAFARAFLLWGLRDYLLPSPQPPTWKTRLRTGLLWLGVGLMQPLSILTAWAVIGAQIVSSGVWQAWQSRLGRAADWGAWRDVFRRAVWTGFLSAPMVIYTFVAFQLDPFLKSWEGQNRILSPQITHYVLAFGMLLPLAILGISPLLREAKWNAWLVIGWVAVFPLLAYAPYNLQRRLPEGVWVAIIILFLKWVEAGGTRVQRWAPRWAFLSFVTTIFILTGGVMTAWSARSPIFVPAEAVRAYEFLAQGTGWNNSRGDQIVLASFQTSNPLPAWAPVRAVTGHGPESVNGVELRQRVRIFLPERLHRFAAHRLVPRAGSTVRILGPQRAPVGRLGSP